MTTEVPARAMPTVDGSAPLSLLRRVRRILDAFGAEGTDLSLSELVAAAGLPKTTVHRLCQELVEWGLLERVEAHRYRLGLVLWELGQRVPRQRALRDVALPHMERLLLDTGETVHCAILDGTEVLYIEKLTLLHGQPRPSRVAGRLPLHCTATGKALLAHAAPALVGQVLSSPLERRTPYTITAPGLLARQLEIIRRTGLAAECEETRLGYRSLAAAVFGPGNVLAGAVSLTAPLRGVPERRVATAVKAAAEAIGRQMCMSSAADG